MGSEVVIQHSLYKSGKNLLKGDDLEINELLFRVDHVLTDKEGYFFDTNEDNLIFGFRTLSDNPNKDLDYFYNVFTLPIEQAEKFGLRNIYESLKQEEKTAVANFGNSKKKIPMTKQTYECREEVLTDIIYNLCEYEKTFATLEEITNLLNKTSISIYDISFISYKKYKTSYFNIIGEIENRKESPSDFDFEKARDKLESYIDKSDRKKSKLKKDGEGSADRGFKEEPEKGTETDQNKITDNTVNGIAKALKEIFSEKVYKKLYGLVKTDTDLRHTKSTKNNGEDTFLKQMIASGVVGLFTGLVAGVGLTDSIWKIFGGMMRASETSAPALIDYIAVPSILLSAYVVADYVIWKYFSPPTSYNRFLINYLQSTSVEDVSTDETSGFQRIIGYFCVTVGIVVMYKVAPSVFSQTQIVGKHFLDQTAKRGMTKLSVVLLYHIFILLVVINFYSLAPQQTRL